MIDTIDYYHHYFITEFLLILYQLGKVNSGHVFLVDLVDWFNVEVSLPCFSWFPFFLFFLFFCVEQLFALSSTKAVRGRPLEIDAHVVGELIDVPQPSTAAFAQSATSAVAYLQCVLRLDWSVSKENPLAKYI